MPPHPHPVEEGTSTGNESEASNHGWSDAAWNPSPASTHPRPSLSSNDDLPSARSQPQPYLLHPHPYPPSTSSSPDPSSSSTAHRRQAPPRSSIHTAGSNIALDALTPPGAGLNPYSLGGLGSAGGTSAGVSGRGSATVLDMEGGGVPGGGLNGGYGQPYQQHSHANGHAHGEGYGLPRSRRKSISAAGAVVHPDSDDDDDYIITNGSASSHTSKGKGRKRNRGGSFSYLPFHRRRRLSNGGWGWGWGWSWGRGTSGGTGAGAPGAGGSSRAGKKPRSAWSTLGLALLALAGVYLLVIWRRTYEIQLEFSIFSRRWIRSEIDSIQPLRGCFAPPLLSPSYNLTQHLAPKRHLLSPGISLKRGMSCYDFSSTIQPIPGVPLEHITYHTYWRSDLIPFGERQTATFLAFLATQPLTHSTLILWTNGADVVSRNPYVKPYLDKWGQYIQVRQVDMPALTKGTELEGVISGLGGVGSGGGGDGKGGLLDDRAWVDGDAVRLMVLWNYGGVWMDMDQLLTRDLHPLTETEWVTQWDCYDKPYFTLNGALMHFQKHSPYLCEAFHIMATSPLPKPNTFTWGSHLYAKLHRALIAGGTRPFAVLPWCFADPRNCRTDNRFPDPFLPDPPAFAGVDWEDGGRSTLEKKVGDVWTVHLHNQWSKKFPEGGWIERLLEGYREQLTVVERYAVAAGLMRDGEIRLAKRGIPGAEGGVEAGAGGEGGGAV
ncbi:hypothetical protein IAT38_007670 [Cryptococcus sp. DSM 104549]